MAFFVPAAVGPNCPGIASANPGLAKYITGAIGFPFALLQVGNRAAGRQLPMLLLSSVAVLSLLLTAGC